MRLLQEILLGICGVRLLDKLGIHPGLVHINEGHAALTGIERLSNYIQKDNMDFDLALELVRSSSLFTTHTPVPAGHDAFSEDLVRAYLPNYNEKLNISWDEFMSLGRINPEDKYSKFSMSIVAAKLSQEMNGVSKIHGEVSKKMFDNLYPGYFAQESHIAYVTNGVHLPFWIGSKWNELYKKKLCMIQIILNRSGEELPILSIKQKSSANSEGKEEDGGREREGTRERRREL